MGGRAPRSGQIETVTYLDALDRLNPHERPRQPRVQAPVPLHVRSQTGRKAVYDDFDHPAERVALFMRRVDFGDHAPAFIGVETPHGVGVNSLAVVTPGNLPGLRDDRPRFDDVGEDTRLTALINEPGRSRAQSDTRGRLTGAGTFENRPRFVKTVFLHSGQSGVTRPRPGQRRVSG